MSLVSDHENTPNSPEIVTFPAEKVWEMMKAIDIAMLVTHGGDGMRARPMSTIPSPGKGVIHILTEAQSTAAQDIARDGTVLLAYAGRGDHLSVAGRAAVNPDKGLVKGLWTPGAQVFWPNGPVAHDVVTLVIDPGHVDVWDGHGVLRGIVSMVRGAVQRRSPDLGERGMTEL